MIGGKIHTNLGLFEQFVGKPEEIGGQRTGRLYLHNVSGHNQFVVFNRRTNFVKS